MLLKKIILKAYLTIILIHEVVHLLKFFKDTFGFKNVSGTPKEKGKEGREVFIEYLFGIGKIRNINYDQAEKIIDFKNWDNYTNLHNIYGDNDNKTEGNFKDNSNYYINFYDTDLEEEEISQEENSQEKDDWCNL